MKKKFSLKKLLPYAIIISAVLIFGIIFYKDLSKFVVEQLIYSVMKSRNVSYEDGLYVGLCGTGSPLPDINRAGPCIAVLAGNHFFIVDAGEGSVKNVLLMNLPISRADAVLLTHFHSDHIADLGELMLQRWAGGSNQEPIDIIGPIGVDQVVQGFNLAYELDAEYRVMHHGAEAMPPSGFGGVAKPFNLSNETNASVVVFDKDGVKITAFNVNHWPVYPAVGYRFEYKNRSVVISGDTAYSESLINNSISADVLFHEALNSVMVGIMNDYANRTGVSLMERITHDIPSYHSTPEDAAKIAESANVKQLIYYHLIPPLPLKVLDNFFIGDAKNYYTGPIIVGEDGLLVFLPPNSDKIKITKVI